MSNTLEYLRRPRAVFTASFSLTADGFVSFTVNGKPLTLVDISNVDWERLVMDVDLQTFTGSSTPSVIFKLKTANTRTGTAVAATTQDAKNGAGTAIASASLTAAGRSLVSVARVDTNGASNIGALVGVYADVSNTITACSGVITLYAGK